MPRSLVRFSTLDDFRKEICEQKLVDLYKCVYNNPRDTSLCLHSIISGKMGKIARGLEIFGSVSFYLVECQSAVESKRELSLEEISI